MQKKYYLDVILKELDTCNGIGPQTYVSCSAHDEEIVLEHEDFIARQNVEIPNDMRQLPTLYWLSKMHKNPIGSRFIAVSSNYSTKPLSQLLTCSLKTNYQTFKKILQRH